MKEKKHISWVMLRSLLSVYDKPGEFIYGVPKGGMICTAFLQRATVVDHPGKATIILDDIIDSGKTRDYYKERYPETPFVALVNNLVPGANRNQWYVFPWEEDHPAGAESDIGGNITRVLEYIGEDPNREGLKDTPARIVRSWEELYKGYSQKPEDILTTFDSEGCDQIVLLKDIELFSTCEHHLLPFFGRAHVAYIPGERVIGISKLARLVDIYARRAQIQERIGEQVTGAIMEHLKPKGAACIIEAVHMCMRMRGVGKQHSTMVTSSMKGAFLENPDARAELMGLIK